MRQFKYVSMLIDADYQFITPGMQKFMLFLYNGNNVPKSYKQQDIYNSQQYFRREMHKLRLAGYINAKDGITKDMRLKSKVYELTIQGMMYVEKNILEFNKKVF